MRVYLRAKFENFEHNSNEFYTGGTGREYFQPLNTCQHIGIYNIGL